MHKLNRFLFPAAACCALVVAPSATADEGMWTFDNPPAKLLQKNYDFTPTKEWLDHVRLSSVRLNDGGSGSFVSPHGLVLTNHHVARGQLQKNSTKEHDYIQDGFYAATPEQELRSPDLEVNVLVSMENVTDRIADAVKNAKSAGQAFEARRAVIAEISRESLQKTGLRSDVVTLYQGGEYWLYRYKQYTDVRLVFAVEQQAAFFGGDPDNFTYPRHDLDMALFRVYENGKPINSTNYLKWNPKGASDNELVFVSGHPGSTSRLETVAQLEFARDVALPATLNILKRRIAVLREYSAQGAEQTRQAASAIFNMENSQKANAGQLQGLQDRRVMAKKQADEQEFRSRVAGNAQWKTQFGGAWDAIAAAEKKAAARTKERLYRSLDSQLASLAMNIVQYVAEVKKPDGKRLPGYQESELESLRVRLFSPAPVYPEMEIARLTGALQLAQSELGANDPFVKTALGGRSPKDAAAALVSGSKLADPAVRKQLIEGGEAAVASSTDSMIALARQLDPLRRELTKWYEDNITSARERAGEQLGKARFAAYGKEAYPDATFSLRLSYGTVQGYPMNGAKAPYKTTFYGLYDRAASFDYAVPFDLPARYREGRDRLELSTPLDFVTTNDVVGGNSGSPVINAKAEIVGLIFDGNIESLVGDFVYEGETNRSVAVHTAAMTEVLTKLYGAQKLVDELTRR